MPQTAGSRDVSRRLGLSDGVLALFHAARFLRRTPRSWPLAAAPICAALLVCGLSVMLVLRSLVPWLIAMLPASGAGWQLAGAAGRGLAALLAAVFGLWLGSWLAPLLSAPALEHLIRLRELSLEAAPRPSAGLWQQFTCALQAQLTSIAVVGPVIALLWIVTWLAPPAALITVPLELLALSGLFAWSTLDYPLSLRGMPVSARITLLRRHAAAVLGYGAALAALFAIPFLSLFVLPVAVVAATELSLAMDPNPHQRATR